MSTDSDICVIEIGLTEDEVGALGTLAIGLNKEFIELAKMCMMERCEDLLDYFEHNVPEHYRS